ncbi:MAG TPA: peptidoglycan-binding domain-containing protein [Pyrinomonadaceae bacterium]
MPPKAPSPNVVLIKNVNEDVLPFLRKGVPFETFTALRSKVIKEAGFDFLSKFGDIMRPRGVKATGPGVATNSRHKCGDAFDYNQGEDRLRRVKEPRNGRMYWRTYLKCVKQDGSQGEPMIISNERALPPAPGLKPEFVYDFTSAAEALGWHRIRAQVGFEKKGMAKKKEFWHYQNTEGYSFAEAIELLYGNPATVAVRPEFPTLRRRDRDDDTQVNVRRDVRQLQAQLYLIKFLKPLTEVDGGFGQNTEAAVRAFQKDAGLPVTGEADEQTRRQLLQRVI